MLGRPPRALPRPSQTAAPEQERGGGGVGRHESPSLLDVLLQRAEADEGLGWGSWLAPASPGGTPLVQGVRASSLAQEVPCGARAPEAAAPSSRAEGLLKCWKDLAAQEAKRQLELERLGLGD